ncbi:hypothetical protein PITC_049050 [Penicillium italicum]|uniref:Uncharacterized protein n=1 Tax=Penicillium italicum TaxID=40296 RepID=A0A0A2K9E7_PENIT|nr:hypothetical protein PITC_049050 [Penicillium italicum]
MTNFGKQPMTEMGLEDRERQLRSRELDLDFERHEFRIEQRKTELEKQELRTQHEKAELEKKESELKKKIEKLKELETEFQQNGPDIIRLEISKKFRRGMIGTKEEELKYRGDVNALQRCRYERYVYEQDLDEKEDRLADFLDLETKLREIAQWENCLKDRYEQDPARIDQELRITEKEYKRIEHERGMIRNYFFDGPLGRAFEFWRAHPRWYMHRVLREDCASRGGCCGRACGCCLNRKLSYDRQSAVGHCTIECGCCHKTRGFELSEDEKKHFATRYAVSRDDKKGRDIQEIQLKNLELQYLHLQHLLCENVTKDTVMKYEFSGGGVAEYERYINEDAITDDEAEFTDEECPSDEEDPPYRRISQASIFGLVDGNFENPFDLIDLEPTCQPTWQFRGSDRWPSNDSMMTETDS